MAYGFPGYSASDILVSDSIPDIYSPDLKTDGLFSDSNPFGSSGSSIPSWVGPATQALGLASRYLNQGRSNRSKVEKEKEKEKSSIQAFGGTNDPYGSWMVGAPRPEEITTTGKKKSGIGGAIGTLVGAGIGTLVAPGAGTALGAQLGGSAGSLGDSFFG